jgi:hypothetical protein
MNIYQHDFFSLMVGLVGVASKLAGAVFPAGHKADLAYYHQKEVVVIFKQVFYEYSIMPD